MKECFTVRALNSNRIKDSDYSTYGTHIKLIEEFLEKANDKNVNNNVDSFQLDFDASYYFNKVFTESVIKHIQSIIAGKSELQHYKLKATRPIQHIKSAPFKNAKSFIFNLDLHNDPDAFKDKSKFQPLLLNLNVQLMINNIANFTLPDEKYHSIIPVNVSDVVITSINIEKRPTKLSFSPSNSGDIYTNITSRLYILDPNAPKD
jgi:hypothetical protein